MSSLSATRDRRAFLGFEIEREIYAQRKAGLLDAAEGRFVVLVGETLLGPFETHEEAEWAGYSTFGLGPLFIKRIVADEPVVEVTRLAVP